MHPVTRRAPPRVAPKRTERVDDFADLSFGKIGAVIWIFRAPFPAGKGALLDVWEPCLNLREIFLQVVHCKESD